MKTKSQEILVLFKITKELNTPLEYLIKFGQY